MRDVYQSHKTYKYFFTDWATAKAGRLITRKEFIQCVNKCASNKRKYRTSNKRKSQIQRKNRTEQNRKRQRTDEK